MKKNFFVVAVVVMAAFSTLLQSCGSSSDKKEWGIELMEELGSILYPSYILSQSLNPNIANDCFVFAYVDKVGAKVKITIEENEFMEACTEETTMTDDDEGIFFPLIKWKMNSLLNATQPGFFNLSAVLEVDGEVIQRLNRKVNYRSVNEVILGYYKDADDEDEEGDEDEESDEESDEDAEAEQEYVDCGYLFTQYVNEDNPKIDEILKEIGIPVVGYQEEDEQSVLNQMAAVWCYFAQKGTHYSSITTTSHEDDVVQTQYVRFFNECLASNQANCIDGTCMLASIYRKMGLDCGIVLVPGHAFLYVYSSEDRENGFFCLETTMMGSEGNCVDVFNAAIEEGNNEYKEAAEKEEADLVNIADCRAEGYKPINK